jgi:hypothetical protein
VACCQVATKFFFVRPQRFGLILRVPRPRRYLAPLVAGQELVKATAGEPAAGDLLQRLPQRPSREQITRQGLRLPTGQNTGFLGTAAEVATAAAAPA